MDWRGVGANPAGNIYFHFEFFAPSPFRTGQRSPCKWNKAWPFTCSHSCFRLQIRFIIQGLVYKYLQYSFNVTCNDISVRRNEKEEVWPTVEIQTPAHLCAVTYMTEISLNLTLNNQIHLTSPSPSANAADMSYGSLTWSSKHRHGTNLLYTVIPRNRPNKSPFMTHYGYVGHILDLTPMMDQAVLKYCTHLSYRFFIHASKLKGKCFLFLKIEMSEMRYLSYFSFYLLYKMYGRNKWQCILYTCISFYQMNDTCLFIRPLLK